jgi:chromate transporter
MAKVDFFAMGGGFTSVPIMYHEAVELRGWFDARTFIDGIAMGQVTPGPVGITATFAGYLLYGLLNAAGGTVAVFSPSLIILLGCLPLLRASEAERPVSANHARLPGLLHRVASWRWQ